MGRLRSPTDNAADTEVTETAPAAPLASDLAPLLPRCIGHKNSGRKAVPPFCGGLPRLPRSPRSCGGERGREPQPPLQATTHQQHPPKF